MNAEERTLLANVLVRLLTGATSHVELTYNALTLEATVGLTADEWSAVRRAKLQS